MPGLDTLPEKDWGKGDSSVVKPVLLARGTLESIDLAKTRRLAEVLGFDCVAPSADRLMLRHRSDRTGDIYWVLEVRQVPAVRSPQHVSNHWGIWVPSRKDVDDAYERLAANAERLGLIRVQKPRPTHEGARDYSFYFEDESRNWWEIGEHPDEDEFMDLFGHGDWDRREGATP
jgi:Glyoxalase/Bleomycin resistance protein/Dioxygenase superfamily